MFIFEDFPHANKLVAYLSPNFVEAILEPSETRKTFSSKVILGGALG